MTESRRILQMLQEGQITVDEANELLGALSSDAEAEGTASEAIGLEETAGPSVPPNLGRFRRLCYIPFAISLIVTLLSGWVAWALYYGREGAISLGFVFMVMLSTFSTRGMRIVRPPLSTR